MQEMFKKIKNYKMKIGTKSILFGAHIFFIHPIFVFIAWWKLYGFPWNPLLWLCFFLHDLGYFGKPNMDGPEGETHPELAANIMKVFGLKWHDMCLYHSRFYAKKNNKQYSKLCVADKLAICLTPAWFYLPCVCLSGEIYEYTKLADAGKYKGQNPGTEVSFDEWFKGVKKYLYEWIEEHKNIKEDNWTPSHKEAINKFGVWK